MNSFCLNSQIMSPAVGMPAEADAPAPRNHVRFQLRMENRRAKSSAPISGMGCCGSGFPCAVIVITTLVLWWLLLYPNEKLDGSTLAKKEACVGAVSNSDLLCRNSAEDRLLLGFASAAGH